MAASQGLSIQGSRFDVQRWMFDALIRPHPGPLPRERGKGAAPGDRQGARTHSSAATSAVSDLQCSMFHVRCWMLDVRCWMLVVGFLTLITRQLVSRPQLRRLKA